MKIKRGLLVVMLTLLSWALLSCSDSNKIQIGILQYADVLALDEAREGFIKGLKDAGYEHGKNINISVLNAHGSASENLTMAKTLVRKSDLILAIATPSATAVVNEAKEQNKNTPILFTAVTDPVGALLIESNENPGGYVTGTNDMNPIKEQVELARELLPNADKFGIIYTASETNSETQADIAKAEAEALGFTVTVKTIINLSELRQVAGQLASSVDVMYVPTDNNIVSSIGDIYDVAIEYDTPVVVAEDNSVLELPALTYSISYYNLGLETARMAVQILKDGVEPKDIPSVGLPEFSLIVNKRLLLEIGIEIPESILNRAERIIE